MNGNTRELWPRTSGFIARGIIGWCHLEHDGVGPLGIRVSREDAYIVERFSRPRVAGRRVTIRPGTVDRESRGLVCAWWGPRVSWFMVFSK